MQAKGFLSSLFDYSFSYFVTPRIIKILYVLATILISLWTLLLVLAAFQASSGFGAVMLLVGGPLFFLLSMIYARVILELIIVFFRINGNVQEIRDGHGGGVKQPAPAPEAPLMDAPAIVPAAPAPETALGPAVIATPIEETPEVSSAASEPAPEVVAEAPTSTVRYCENCGAERSPSARYCTSCGHE
jgi:hypothetical protein